VARRPRGQLRQDILDTVIELLMNTGDVASVSIDAVVDRVGCTPPALYYYFPTKNELLWQACDAEFAKLADHIEDDVSGGGPASQLVELERRGTALLHWAAEHPALYHILFMGSGRDGLIRGNTWQDPSLLATMGNVQACIDHGLIRSALDPKLIALSLWATVHGFASLTVTFRHIPLAVVEQGMVTACTPILLSLLTPLGAQQYEQVHAARGDETRQNAGVGRP
jgi:AcrR family transcriptional regulator